MELKVIIWFLNWYLFHVNSFLSIPLIFLNSLLNWTIIIHDHFLNSFLWLLILILSWLINVIYCVLNRNIFASVDRVNSSLYRYILLKSLSFTGILNRNIIMVTFLNCTLHWSINNLIIFDRSLYRLINKYHITILLHAIVYFLTLLIIYRFFYLLKINCVLNRLVLVWKNSCKFWIISIIVLNF